MNEEMLKNKKKMAFVDLSNFEDWPMGGMLEYERTILEKLVYYFDVDIWGVSVDSEINEYFTIDNEKYPIHIWGNAKTKRKIIPNYWRGLNIQKNCKTQFKDYDIVYAHTGSCIVALNHVIDHSKTLLVYHQHGLSHRGDYALKSLVQRPLLNRALQVADLTFVVSDEESVQKYALEIQNKCKGKFVAIGSPINLQGIEENELVLNRKNRECTEFIYVGRIDEHKDVKTLIEAFALYIKINSDARLTIVGTGEQIANVEKIIKELQIESKVEMVGSVTHDEVFNYLKKSDIYLTASIGEGVSIAVLEAYAVGVPVVCFKVPGLEKQVVDNVTGVISKQHSANGLCEAMVKAHKMQNELSHNCIEEVKKYDVNKIVGKIAEKIEMMMVDNRNKK